MPADILEHTACTADLERRIMRRHDGDEIGLPSMGTADVCAPVTATT